mgnify:CR=1 FL=1
MICNSADIAIIPFPFVDRNKSKPRPAVVLSTRIFNKKNQHTIFSMITTGKNTIWPSDIIITSLKSTGLTSSSVIRFKIFTLDNRLIKKVIGKLSQQDQHQLQRDLNQSMPMIFPVNS